MKSASGITPFSVPFAHKSPAIHLPQDVDLRQLHLAVGDRELLADAHLRLAAGTRYGLVGRCGGWAGRGTRAACLMQHDRTFSQHSLWPMLATPAPAPARTRNGVGKSTLLKAMGWGLVIGFPKNLRCL